MRKYLLFFMFVCFSACKTNEFVSPEKEVKNPVQALAWLNAMVHPTSENVYTVSAVEAGSYQG